MSASCSSGGCASETGLNDPRWRRALWIALAVNAGMFVLELTAGVSADSRALMADALDFLGDAANYAISLVVAGMALAWRAKAALFKGITLIILALWVIGSTVHAMLVGASPDAGTMGAIGVLALIANVGVALLLYRFRTGDANMRSVWICSRIRLSNSTPLMPSGQPGWFRVTGIQPARGSPPSMTRKLRR